jgi:hypothetical protein
MIKYRKFFIRAMNNIVKKIVFFTLVVASIGGICYGAWYGLGKWGYDKVSAASSNIYKKNHPELASILNESKNLPVKMTGFPFSWRFELDSEQSEKTKALFSKMIKVLSQQKFSKTPLTQKEGDLFNQLIEKTNIDGQFNIGWPFLWSPHPWQSKLQLSFGPFDSFMIHIKGETQANLKKINKEILDIDLVKDEETLSTFKANCAIHNTHMDIDVKGKVDHKIGDHITKHSPSLKTAFITGLLKNTLLPFDFSINMRTIWDQSNTNKERPVSLFFLALNGQVISEGDCQMTFKDKKISCHFGVFMDGYNQETGTLEKLKFQISFPKQKVLELFEKIGLPPVFGPFFIEKEDQLIFKFEKNGEQQIINEKPL